MGGSKAAHKKYFHIHWHVTLQAAFQIRRIPITFYHLKLVFGDFFLYLFLSSLESSIFLPSSFNKMICCDMLWKIDFHLLRLLTVSSPVQDLSLSDFVTWNCWLWPPKWSTLVNHYTPGMGRQALGDLRWEKWCWCESSSTPVPKPSPRPTGIPLALHPEFRPKQYHPLFSHTPLRCPLRMVYGTDAKANFSSSFVFPKTSSPELLFLFTICFPSCFSAPSSSEEHSTALPSHLVFPSITLLRVVERCQNSMYGRGTPVGGKLVES